MFNIPLFTESDPSQVVFSPNFRTINSMTIDTEGFENKDPYSLITSQCKGPKWYASKREGRTAFSSLDRRNHGATTVRYLRSLSVNIYHYKNKNNIKQICFLIHWSSFQHMKHGPFWEVSPAKKSRFWWSCQCGCPKYSQRVTPDHVPSELCNQLSHWNTGGVK